MVQKVEFGLLGQLRTRCADIRPTWVVGHCWQDFGWVRRATGEPAPFFRATIRPIRRPSRVRPARPDALMKQETNREMFCGLGCWQTTAYCKSGALLFVRVGAQRPGTRLPGPGARGRVGSRARTWKTPERTWSQWPLTTEMTLL